jgi:RimJ/RimL family protein N-acetyltransferase
VIYGDRIRFRAPEKEDIPMFVDWLNDPEVRAGLVLFLPMSVAKEEHWFENMLKRPQEEQPLTIEVQDEGGWNPIGNVGLFGFNYIARSAEAGIMIGEKAYWDQGYGTEAMKLLLKHGFETLNLNRISLQVFTNNPRAVRCYEKVGFVLEGRLRQAKFTEGVYYDVLWMSVIREEWTSEG